MRSIYLIVLLLVSAWDAEAQRDTGFVYQKPLFDFDRSRPLFRLEGEQASNESRNLRFTALTRYREGVKPTEGPFRIKFEVFDDFNAGTVKFMQYNLSIADLLSQGLYKQIVLEVKDVSKYMYRPEYGDREAWMRENTLCFEYVFPQSEANPMALAQQSLSDFLGVKTRIEKRMMRNPETGEMKEEKIFIITELENE